MIYTDISYPDGLPWPVREGYGIKHARTFTRTDMESGRAAQRRKFSSVPSEVSVTYIFTGDSEAAAFEAWFRDALKDGAEWFNSPLKTPIGEQNYVCRFTSMYTGPDLFALSAWRIRATLEIFERPLMPPGWGENPNYLIHASLFDFAMNREWPEA